MSTLKIIMLIKSKAGGKVNIISGVHGVIVKKTGKLNW